MASVPLGKRFWEASNDTIISNYREFCENISEKTWDNYFLVLTRFRNATNDKPFSKITQSDIDNWKRALNSIAVSSRNVHAIIVRKFLRWLGVDVIVTFVPILSPSNVFSSR